MRLSLAVLLIALPALLPTLAHGQTALYRGGTIYDLDPPAQQSTGQSYLETMIVSLKEQRMRPVMRYNEGDIIRRLGRPVGRLSMRVDLGERDAVAFCTASLIADDLILTNHHCIAGNPDGEVEDALLWMGYLQDGSREGVEQYGVELAPVEADAGLDYAIHKVRGEPGAVWGTVALARDAGLRPGQSLFVLHHPGGWAQHVSLACETGDPALGDPGLLHGCDTLGGSSGSPVFDNGERLVVGLHYRVVRPGELNAARPISDIVAASPTLQRLSRQATAEPTAAGLLWERIGASDDPAVLALLEELYPDAPEAALARERRLALLAPGSADGADPAAVHACDRLAAPPGAHPGVPGVAFSDIVGARAVPACRAAVERFPQEGRFAGQLGRALDAAGQAADAVDWYRRAAEAGDAVAMGNLGVMYEHGTGVGQSTEEAMAWYRRAAEAGNAIAMTNLGLAYANARGVPQDYEAARSWYRRAAEAGDTLAMVNLGGMYLEGIGVEADAAEAARWFEMGAADGDPTATSALAALRGLGVGVSKDTARSLALFHSAAEAGDPGAMKLLGDMHATGTNVPRDMAEAVRWYRRAAEAGQTEAMERLAELYEAGEGVTADPSEAARWRRRAGAR